MVPHPPKTDALPLIPYWMVPGDSWLLLLLHLLTAALERAAAAFGDDDLRIALRADVHFPQLIGHGGLDLLLVSLGCTPLCLVAAENRLPLLQERGDAFLPIPCGL